ncbi:MAG: hypothetical protein ACHREM_11830 [Polyangiales bacterium]
MTDWSKLAHAYGTADDLPALLGSLTPDPHSQAWDKLWSRVCHQGTVYPASFATLPILCELATCWAPAQRFQPLVLAGAIAASISVVGLQAEHRDLEATIAELHSLALNTLPAVPDATNSEFVYLLQATLALGGDRVWGRVLDRLVDGEFEADCASCSAELFIVVGSYGTFVTCEEWVNRPSTKRVAIRARSAAAAPTTENWLIEQSCGPSRATLRGWFLHLFGDADCPACGATNSLAERIAASAAE